MNKEKLNNLIKILLSFSLLLIILVELYDAIDNSKNENNDKMNNNKNIIDNFTHTNVRGRIYNENLINKLENGKTIMECKEIKKTHGLETNYNDILRKNQYLINSVEAFNDGNNLNTTDKLLLNNIINDEKVLMKLKSGKEIIFNDNIPDIKSMIDDKFDMSDNIYYITNVNLLKNNIMVKLFENVNYKGNSIVLRNKKDYLDLKKRSSNIIGVINDKRIINNEWIVNDNPKLLNIKSIQIMDDIESHTYNGINNIDNVIDNIKNDNDNYNYLNPILSSNNNMNDVINISKNVLNKYRTQTNQLNNNIKQKEFDIENNIKFINNKKNNIGLQQASNDYFYIKKLHNEVLNK